MFDWMMFEDTASLETPHLKSNSSFRVKLLISSQTLHQKLNSVPKISPLKSHYRLGGCDLLSKLLTIYKLKKA